MATLLHPDLQWALLLCPKQLLLALKMPAFAGKVFVGGGFLRSAVCRDSVNDIDVFASDANTAEAFAELLVRMQLGIRPIVSASDVAKQKENAEKVASRIYRTDNALTLRCYNPTIQIIYRWTFPNPETCARSFDFTCVAAVFGWKNGKWISYCDDHFYADNAAKRLTYTSPVRIEEAGGSMLRVLKYYRKGYSISIDSLGKVIARLASAYEMTADEADHGKISESNAARVFTGLLREVDPSIDPAHVAHLPAEDAPDSGDFNPQLSLEEENT